MHARERLIEDAAPLMSGARADAASGYPFNLLILFERAGVRYGSEVDLDNVSKRRRAMAIR